MRELTKSMLSFSWVMPLFGMKQMMDMAMPRDPSRPFGNVTDNFEAVTRAAQDQMGGAWSSAFRAGDQIQRGMVDLMFSFFSPDAWNPNRMMRTTSDMMQRSMGAAGQMAGAWPGSGSGMCACAPPPATGWGPMPGAQSGVQSGIQSGIQAATAVPAAMASVMAPPAGWRVSTPKGV
ncbi:MAG: hypothetical protein QOF89_5551 [Acidobacteriota bacterium]|jgi:hypothetical protein|nr:hypothetical protein [Acidobacteriota bacterium]